MPKNGQIWPKIGILGQFGPGHAFGALLVGRLVVVARAVSRKTHIYFIFSLFDNGKVTDLQSFEEISHICATVNWQSCEGEIYSAVGGHTKLKLAVSAMIVILFVFPLLSFIFNLLHKLNCE